MSPAERIARQIALSVSLAAITVDASGDDMQTAIDLAAEAISAAIAEEKEAICQIVFGQCGSDNVAQRIVDAIRARI